MALVKATARSSPQNVGSARIAKTEEDAHHKPALLSLTYLLLASQHGAFYATLGINCRSSNGMFVQMFIECHSSNDCGGNSHEKIARMRVFQLSQRTRKAGRGNFSAPFYPGSSARTCISNGARRQTR